MSGIYFSQTRNVELSTIEFLSSVIAASWNNVTVLKSFTQAFDKGVNPPIVTIRLDDTALARREIGSDALVFTHTIFIDIFARSDAQRIDLAHFIIDKLKDGWPFSVFQHQSGNRTVLESTAVGRLQVMEWISDSKVNVGLENVDTKERFRHIIAVGIRTFLAT